jgi:hypothetical protein
MGERKKHVSISKSSSKQTNSSVHTFNDWRNTGANRWLNLDWRRSTFGSFHFTSRFCGDWQSRNRDYDMLCNRDFCSFKTKLSTIRTFEVGRYYSGILYNWWLVITGFQRRHTNTSLQTHTCRRTPTIRTTTTTMGTTATANHENMPTMRKSSARKRALLPQLWQTTKLNPKANLFGTPFFHYSSNALILRSYKKATKSC